MHESEKFPKISNIKPFINKDNWKTGKERNKL